MAYIFYRNSLDATGQRAMKKSKHRSMRKWASVHGNCGCSCSCGCGFAFEFWRICIFFVRPLVPCL